MLLRIGPGLVLRCGLGTDDRGFDGGHRLVGGVLGFLDGADLEDSAGAVEVLEFLDAEGRHEESAVGLLGQQSRVAQEAERFACGVARDVEFLGQGAIADWAPGRVLAVGDAGADKVDDGL